MKKRINSFIIQIIFIVTISSVSCSDDGDNEEVLPSCSADTLENPNLLKSLLEQDRERERYLLDFDVTHVDPLISNGNIIKNHFYRILSSHLQTYCGVSKNFGGVWLPNCAYLDGEKFVCMDKLADDIKRGKCLIYSFGISDDWSFEDTMDELGCEIHAFDPTIDAPAKRGRRIHFHRLGIAHYTGTTQVLENKSMRYVTADVSTLSDIFRNLKHENREISYLKLDVEGSEIKSLPEWSRTGILKNVRQIGVELHMGLATNNQDENLVLNGMIKLIRAFQELYRQGFRIVNYNPNNCVGKSQDKDRRYTAYADIVLYNIN